MFRHTEKTIITKPVSKANRPKPSRYLEDFLNLRCNVDLQLLEVFPNTKEITESMAMAKACFKLHADRGSADVTAICVGDGTTPRTGALLAHLTTWQVVSVDPKMHRDAKYDKVKRLLVVNKQIENAGNFMGDKIADQHVIIVACHSHAGLRNSVDAVLHCLPLSVAVVSMECCKSDDLSVNPDISYKDASVWSPKNQVQVWRSRHAHFWWNQKPIELPRKVVAI